MKTLAVSCWALGLWVLTGGLAADAQEVDMAQLGPSTGVSHGTMTLLGSRLYVASVGSVRAYVRASGALDLTVGGGDGILGNSGGERTYVDAEFVTTDGTSLFVTDDSDNLVYVVDPVTGALLAAVGTDGIIGNDTGGANPEPTFTNAKDVAVSGGVLYVADAGGANAIRRYQLAGAGGLAVTLATGVSAYFLELGPAASAAPCNSASTFAGGQLLYTSDLNDDIRCVDTAGTSALLLDASSLAMRDLAFGPPVGSNCGTLLTFNGGAVLYSSEANGVNELRCTGRNGATFLSNDADVGPAYGIARASDNTLYQAGAGTDQNLYSSVAPLPVELLGVTVQ
jgi:hypothetical protein